VVLPVGDVNPTHRRPLVTRALILINLAVFAVLQLPADGCEALAFVYRYGAVPRELVSGAPLPAAEVDALLGSCGPVALSSVDVALSVVTAMFVHGGIGHLLGNLLFLWVFGDNVEDRLGRLRFLGFYLVGGAAATVAYTFTDPSSTVPLVGASGAIAAVLGAYLVCFPRATVMTYVPFPLYLVAVVVPGLRIRSFWFIFAIVAVPAWLVLGSWFVVQSVASGSALSDGVAYQAHVAGFVAGIVLLLLLDRGRRRRGRPTYHPVRRR
jgi:membrane associated rhomboid family serine protease